MSIQEINTLSSSQEEVRIEEVFSKDHKFGEAHSLNKELVRYKAQDWNIDLNMANRFLSTLASTTEQDLFTFQIFPEGTCEREKVYPQILHGSLENQASNLIAKNHQGCGVYVTVNETDGKGRKEENILKVRALFVDLDGSALEPVLDAPIEPHIVIESSPGRYHAYWIVENVQLENFSIIQKALAKKFDGDPAVNDLSRVMRLPGFYHLKKEPQLSKILFESGQQPCSIEKFLSAFEINISDEHATTLPHDRNNPILETLKRYKLLIRKEGHLPNCWIVKCPWEHLHSSKDSGTKYFEPEKGNIFGGFKCFHAHCEGKNIQDLLLFLGLKKENLEPLPLHRSIASPNPYPIETLGEVLSQATKAIQSIVKAPDAICAQSVLGAAALACQAFANIEIDGRIIPLSLFLLSVAESGERKSGVDQIALQPVYAWQEMRVAVHRSEYQNYERLYEVWEAQKKDFLKAIKQGVPSSGFEIPEPVKPLEPSVLVDEPTYEGVVKLLAVGQPSMGIFSDEGGRFFGGHAMNRDNQIKTISGLSSLWDGKPVNRSRAGDGTMILYGRRVSLHLMIQESIFAQLIGDKGIEQQGFLPRCLISFPASTAGRRPYSHQDANKNEELVCYRDKINSLLDVELPVDPLPAPQNELKPRILNLTDSAKVAWVKFHDAIDKNLAPGGNFESIRRFGSKAAEHVLRLSGIIAMIDDPTVKLIEEKYIHMGITLMEYYLSEVVRVQGYLSIPHNLVLAQKVLDWCWMKNKEELILRDLYQYGPNEVREVKKAREIMTVLEEHGWAKKLDKGKASWTIVKKLDQESC